MNVFEIAARLFLDKSDYDKGLDDAEGKASKFGGALKSAMGATVAAVGAATGAAAAAVGKLVKSSVEQYAEYEQLVGGAQLMYGDAYKTVAENAANAYKNVQMSQNEYLTQVNGFATGLKTSLGGNAEAAAELADKIVTAEADIVAATGNSQEAVQNAFNGIMRSNFTMLDNLQIGITPTKEGFQEVIDKVNEWNAAQGKATDYQMGNLADMQSALVDYVDMVGMAGYAQNEAAETIQGSLASAKSAWSNLVTGIADDNADFDSLVGGFVESAASVAENILPRVETALSGVASLVEKLFPVIAKKIPPMISSILPELITAAAGIVQALLDGISQNIGMLTDTVAMLVTTIVDLIVVNLPMLVDGAIQIVTRLATALSENADQMVDGVVQMVLALVDIISNPDNLTGLLEAGLQIIMALATGILEHLPELSVAAVEMMANLAGFILTNTPTVLSAIGQLGIELISAIGQALASVFGKIGEWFGSLFSSLGQWLGETLSKIGSFLSQLPELIAYHVGYAVGSFIAFFRDLPEKISEFLSTLISNVKTFGTNFASEAPKAARNFFDGIVNGLKDLPSKVAEIGHNVVEGLKNGIKNAWSGFVEWIMNLAKSIITGFKDGLGIKSPSRLMRDIIGLNVVKGLQAGLEAGEPALMQSVENIVEDMEDGFADADFDIASPVFSGFNGEEIDAITESVATVDTDGQRQDQMLGMMSDLLHLLRGGIDISNARDMREVSYA